MDLSQSDPKLIRAIRARLKTDLEPWQRTRLLVAEQAVLGRLTPEAIAKMHRVSRRTVFSLKKTVREGEVASLLTRGKSTGRPSTLKGTRLKEFEAKVRRGTFESIEQAQDWVLRRTGALLTRRGILKLVGRSRERGDEQTDG